MISLTKLSRERFLGWIGGQLRPDWVQIPPDEGVSVIRELPEPAEGEVYVLRDSESDERPVGAWVALDGDAINEFLAFASTFISTYKPFTAFCHVVPLTALPEIFHGPRLGRASEIIRTEIVGVAIAEVQIHLPDGRFNADRISVSACEATLSNAVIAAMKRGYGPDIVRDVIDRWIVASSIVSSRKRTSAIDRIADFWRFVSAAWSDPPGIANQRTLGEAAAHDFVRKFLRFREFSEEAWKHMTSESLGTWELARFEADNREDQLKMLDGVYASLLSSPWQPPARDIVIAALLALIAQGSFEYLSLAREFEGNSSNVMLWFSLFCALHKSSDVFSIGNCLGRRVARELDRPRSMYSAPECDIAFEELYVLSGDVGGPQFRTEAGSWITVELFPGVNAKFPAGRRNNRESSGVVEADSADLLAMRELLNRFREIVDRIGSRQKGEKEDALIGLEEHARPHR